MKPSNKILLFCLILLLASVTIHKIIRFNKTELVPNVFAKGFADTIITSNDFSSLEIKGGYIVEVIKDTAAEIRFEAPRILLNEYTRISNDSKTLKISSALDMSKFWHYSGMKIRVKTIESVNASSGAIVTLKGFESHALNVTADDSSVVMSSNCRYHDSRITASGRSIVSLNNTKNAVIELRNSSRLAITFTGGVLDGKVSPESVLLTEGELTQDKVRKTKLQ